MRRIILTILSIAGIALLSQPAFPQVSGSDSSILVGDLNEDSRIDIFDLLDLLKVLSSGQTGSVRRTAAANVDGSADDAVNIFDLLGLLKVLAGMQEPRTVTFAASVAEVWAVGDGEKIFKDDLDHFARQSNSVWDGGRVSLKGLYNEVLGFQVIVVADSQGAKGVEITVDPIINEETGGIIGVEGTSPYDPGAGSSFSVNTISRWSIRPSRTGTTALPAPDPRRRNG